MDLTQRIDQPELMDTRSFPAAVMRETLEFLAVTNRFFGGTAVVLDHFKTWSRRWDKSQTIRVLDVGTGGAEIPIALARWARSKGFPLEITAIDLVSEIVDVAQQNAQPYREITVRQQDVFDLAAVRHPGESRDPGLKHQGKDWAPAFAGATRFDYVVASLLLHHIPTSQSVRLLKTFDALAQRGVLVSDLFRSKPSYLAVKSLSWLLGNDVVRHDGPLSVRRAFRVEELSGLAAQAGLPYLMARREPWFRVSLSGEKPFSKTDPSPRRTVGEIR